MVGGHEHRIQMLAFLHGGQRSGAKCASLIELPSLVERFGREYVRECATDPVALSGGVVGLRGPEMCERSRGMRDLELDQAQVHMSVGQAVRGGCLSIIVERGLA